MSEQTAAGATGDPTRDRDKPSKLAHGNSTSSKSHLSSASGSTGAVTSSSVVLTPVEEMYRIYEKINTAQDRTGLEKEYRVFIGSVSKSEQEKKLASQFIPRFLDSFPGLSQEAFDAMLDLCEDDDPQIRRQVVKDVVVACSKIPKFVPKIADVLGQMMETADPNEIAGIERTLTSLFHIDAPGALVGLFNQIYNGEDLAKERCVKFLGARVLDLGPEIITPDFENSLFDEASRVLKAADRGTFKSITSILFSTKYLQQLNGQQAMVDLLAQAIEIDRPLSDVNEEKIRRLVTITNMASELFTSKISSTPFVVYFCTKVLTELPRILALPDGAGLRVELAKEIANCATAMTRIEDKDVNDCIGIVFEELKLHLPLPPESGEPNTNLEFGLIECLLIIFHKLSVFDQKFLLQEPGRLLDIRKRLQYCARGSQALMIKLREDLGPKKGDELKKPENCFKISANITTMIRDVFHNPPSFSSNITPSWKPIAKVNIQKRAAAVRAARTLPLAKEPKMGEMKLYQPPSGKYSQRGGRFNAPTTPGKRPRAPPYARGDRMYAYRNSRS